MGVERAEVAEGSQDIRVEAGECLERAYKAVCMDLRNPHGEPRSAVVVEASNHLSGSR
jgi:hypothetical protein